MSRNADDIDITAEEADRFKKAFEDEEFRKLFMAYAEEISDPKNKELYDLEIQKLEAQTSGDHVEVVRPEPGFVIKTRRTDGSGGKVFINVCHSAKVAPASPKSDGERAAGSTGVLNPNAGAVWQFPYSMAPGRDEKDKSGNPCRVYDAVFATETYNRAAAEPRFKALLISTATDAVSEKFGEPVAKAPPELKVLANKKFFGTARPSMIRPDDTSGQLRSQPRPSVNDILPGVETEGAAAGPSGGSSSSSSRRGGGSGGGGGSSSSRSGGGGGDSGGTSAAAAAAVTAALNRGSSSGASGGSSGGSGGGGGLLIEEVGSEPAAVTAPDYKIVHRGEFRYQDHTFARVSSRASRPSELVVRIELPLVDSVADVDLEVSERDLRLLVPDVYDLEVSLPFPVDDEEGSAEFVESDKRLIVTLPVLPPDESVDEVAAKMGVGIQPIDGEGERDGEAGGEATDNAENDTEAAIATPTTTGKRPAGGQAGGDSESVAPSTGESETGASGEGASGSGSVGTENATSEKDKGKQARHDASEVGEANEHGTTDEGGGVNDGRTTAANADSVATRTASVTPATPPKSVEAVLGALPPVSAKPFTPSYAVRQSARSVTVIVRTKGIAPDSVDLYFTPTAVSMEFVAGPQCQRYHLEVYFSAAVDGESARFDVSDYNMSLVVPKAVQGRWDRIEGSKPKLPPPEVSQPEPSAAATASPAGESSRPAEPAVGESTKQTPSPSQASSESSAQPSTQPPAASDGVSDAPTDSSSDAAACGSAVLGWDGGDTSAEVAAAATTAAATTAATSAVVAGSVSTSAVPPPKIEFAVEVDDELE